MIPDWETTEVFFSALLPVRHPDFWSRFAGLLAGTGVEPRLLAGTRDVWARDFMPVQVAASEFVLFQYRPDYLHDNAELVTPDEARQAVPLGARLCTSDINLDGGNVVASSDKAILTEKVYKENPEHARPALREELAAILRANCIFIPKEPYDVIGHADGVVRFIDEEVVVVNDYRELDRGYGARLEADLRRHGLTVERLPHFRTDEVVDGIPSAAGNYVNFLRVGKLVIVPAYGVPQDDLACETLELLLPGARVMPLRCGDLAREGGVLNCVAWAIRTEPTRSSPARLPAGR